MAKHYNRFRHLPNIITSLNMLCGCAGSILAFNNDLIMAAVCIFAAVVFDFLDGLTARIFNAYSKLGKELDSLADIISFGFAPSVIIFQMLKNNLNIGSFSLDLPVTDLIILLLPFLIVIFSGIRLAKFNIDERQTEIFIGLPTPANALFIISLPIILEINGQDFLTSIIQSNIFLFILIIVSCFLLVAEFPMLAIKFKNLKFRDNKMRYLLIFISIILIILLQLKALPLIIIFYILLSAINNWIIKT